jgi:hypothetical protein
MPQRARKNLSPSDEAEAIQLHLEGHTLRHIAEQLDSSFGTIQRLVKRYQQASLNGIPDYPERPPSDQPITSIQRNVELDTVAEPIAETVVETTADATPNTVAHPVAETAAEAVPHPTVKAAVHEATPTTALTTVKPTLHPTVQATVQATASRLDQHEARLLALEGWIATIQQRPELRPLITSTPPAIFRQHSEPARPRSIQMETDLFDTLRRFCRAEGRQMKEVVDTVLSEFFHSRGWIIEEGETHG